MRSASRDPSIRRALAGVLAVACLATGAMAPALAREAAGVTERVSLRSNDTEGFQNSVTPSMSADGRYVAFTSKARLVPRDTDRRYDVFLRDRIRGVTRIMSVRTNGTAVRRGSEFPSISADGRYVAFTSRARLAPRDTDRISDVYVRDRVEGVTQIMSVRNNGTPGLRRSISPSISADGRYVAFASWARLTIDDTDDFTDVYVRDRVEGVTQRVSVSSDETPGDGYSWEPSMSAGGRYVAFESSATNLVDGDTNGDGDVFVRDLADGVTRRVSIGSDDIQGDSYSNEPSISADGRHVAFTSDARNLVTDDTNDSHDVFVRDLVTARTSLVSRGTDGTPSRGFSYLGSISANGRYVAFTSQADDLVTGAGAISGSQVFVRDLVASRTRLVSVSTDGTYGHGWSSFGSVSADGRYVAFDSDASDLVSGDTNDLADVFVRDQGAGRPASKLPGR
jgi:Tol biopolymer transport system component